MTTPRVSILMPVYNVASYLREAMDSMLAQTYTDFELIVLDDCSPDNSAEILDTYTDERIVRYRGEKNMGLSNVLNVGMAMARGEFIARMDSDDISTPERLATQVAYLDEHPEVDLCSCGMELFGAKQETWVRETNVEDVKITALFHSPILHASSMWRREAFERVELRFLQEMVPAEDYDMWTRAMAAGLRLVNIPEVMYLYRIHPSQATTQTDKTAKKDREVKANYLRMLYPTEDMSTVNLLPAQSASDLERIKQSVAHLLEANKRTPFLEQVRLKKRMWNYYYRQVVNCLAVHFEWRLVGELSWKWRIKWLLSKKMKKILNKIGITKSILRDWRKIAWTQLLWRAKGRKTALLSVVPYKGTCIDCHSSAQIDGSGVLCLNRSWTKSNPFKTLLVLNRNAHLQIEGNVDIYGDSTIYVNENATLIFRGGYMNNRLNISVFDRVEIGRKVYVSENVSIRDSDNHTLMYDGKTSTNISAPIVIEDNVWIGMNVTILKGVHIGTGAVIAAGAVVTKNVPAGCLAAGVPAKVIRENISWI